MTRILAQLHCFRCGYEWFPKSSQKPRKCARCNSPYWDMPRRVDRLSEFLEKARAVGNQLQAKYGVLPVGTVADDLRRIREGTG